MATLCVPELEPEPWPTLGPQVVEFIRDRLVHGPGDLKGTPAIVDPEFEAELYRIYEVFPRDHPRAGRRRFKRVVLEERKGTAKTERAAWLAIIEAHPEGPVRCDGFRKRGKAWVPVGRPVTDPYIPLVAYTEEQTEELAFGAVRVILEECALGADFDIALERVLVLGAGGRAAGKIVPLASSPNARDGARTTFQHFDETHRFVLPNLKRAHATMLANIPKRPMADPWSLETTTAFAPGEDSVGEQSRQYAEQIAAGLVRDPQLFYFSRWASDEHDITTDPGLEAAIVEATGPNRIGWTDVPTIAAAFREPNADVAYLERVWLNRRKQQAAQAFDAARWAELADIDHLPADDALVVLGVDGARYEDALAVIATEVETGFQWPVGIWERPEHAGADYEHPADEIDQVMLEVFDRFDVWRAYVDPQWIDHLHDRWSGRWTDKVIVKWLTHRRGPMAAALAAYRDAQSSGTMSHNGDQRFAAHVGNAFKVALPQLDEDGRRTLWLIRKERPNSWRKIDAAMAGCLSWEARGDAIAAGVLKRKRRSRRLVSF